MALIRLLILCIALVLVFVSCDSDPSGPVTISPKGDTTARSLSITPDSATLQVNTSCTFTVSVTPGPLPKPYTIVWRIDGTPLTRANTDSVSHLFTTTGIHSVNATYVDSLGTARDSAATIVTVSEIPKDTTTLPATPGSFKLLVNADTLDRANVYNFCDATASIYDATIDGVPAHRIITTFNYSQFEYQPGFGDYQISFWVGLKTLAPATYPIAADGNDLGCFARQRKNGIMSSSIPGSGSFTVAEIDTVKNTISGSFTVLVAQWGNPNAIDTVRGAFRNVCIHLNLFGQGRFTATAGTLEFSPDYKRDFMSSEYVPGTDVLSLHAIDSDSDQSLGVSVYSPKVGTFPLAWPPFSGDSYVMYSAGFDNYGMLAGGWSGSVVITKYDAVTRRVSGTFSFTLKSDKGKTITVTDGVIDNVMFAID